MEELEEQRVCVCVCVYVCVCVCEILLQTWETFYRDFSVAYLSLRGGLHEPNAMLCYKWFKRFKEAECRPVKIPGLYDIPH